MIDYKGGSMLTLIFRARGSLVPHACLYGLAGVFVTLAVQVANDLFPEFQKTFGISQEDIGESQIWAASTAILVVLSGFRVKQALDRFWEGTSLLHQMRGEWYDSVSCLMTFSRQADISRKQEVDEFRHTLIRLMSLCHGSALEEVQGQACDSFDIIDIAGLDYKTLSFLKKCRREFDFNRVEVLLHMIQVLMTQALEDGVINVPPPILSRVYQTLSRGLVNLLNAKKITDTMFPFPLAQLIALMLVTHTVLSPILIAALIPNKIVSALVTFLAVFATVAVNLIASELEIPYGDGENHLPLRRFQREMNKSLLLFMHDMSDHLPHPSRSYVTSFDQLIGKKAEESKISDRRKTILEKMAEPPEGIRTKQRRTTIIDMLEASVLAGMRGSFSVDDFAHSVQDLKTGIAEEDGESAGSGHSIWQAYSSSSSEEDGQPDAMDNRSSLRDCSAPKDEADAKKTKGKSLRFVEEDSDEEASPEAKPKPQTTASMMLGKPRRVPRSKCPDGDRGDNGDTARAVSTENDDMLETSGSMGSVEDFDSISPNAPKPSPC